ncbi:unnamed protein product [Ranitomeya imitator]|uniref:Uncharacterized protein n=1 Tax=Ranitomeya imitator TaxID=111125 RepID=A0ABN9LD35_9NEOB|nr:unnamed protein product [Ranitomeya imitator]
MALSPPMPHDERVPPPPRRRRHGRSQQQDKPPRFRRLKQERENAARAGNGSGPPPPQQQITAMQDQHPRPAPPEEDRPVPRRGHKSPEPCNANSDQANEEWETASESSDFTEKKEKADAPVQNGGLVVGPAASTVGRDQRKDLSKRSFSSQRPVMERQNRRPMHPGGPRVGRGGGGGGRSGEKRSWPSPRNRGGRINDDRPPSSVHLSHPPPNTSTVYRVDHVIHSDPAGIHQALSELGQQIHGKAIAVKQNVELPSGRSQPRTTDPILDSCAESVGESLAVPQKRNVRCRRTRETSQEAVLHAGMSVSAKSWAQPLTRGHRLESLGIWNREQSNDRGKLGAPYPVDSWMEPLNPYEDAINTEASGIMSHSDSGVDLSSDSQLSSSSCSQRSSPDGGLKPEGSKRSGRSAGRLPHGRFPLVGLPPDPIGMERAQKSSSECPGVSSTPSCLSSPPPSPSAKELCVSTDGTKQGRDAAGTASQHPCMTGSSPQSWDPPPTSAAVVPQMDPRQVTASPAHLEGTRPQVPGTKLAGPDLRQMSDRWFGSQLEPAANLHVTRPSSDRGTNLLIYFAYLLSLCIFADDRSQRVYPNQYYQVDVHVTSTGSGYRPGTPSLQPFRSQPLYLHAAPSPASTPALLPTSALVSGIALKGQYLEFSDLSKVPAGSLLYQAPAFLYSGHYCPAQVGTDQQQHLVQVRQDMASASDYYSAPLHHAGQSGYLTTAPTQQVLLSMVDAPLPVMGFGSLSSAAPQTSLVPMGQALQPLHQLSAAGRALPHNVRNEAIRHTFSRSEARRPEEKWSRSVGVRRKVSVRRAAEGAKWAPCCIESPHHVTAPHCIVTPHFIMAPRYVAALPRYVAALPRYVAALPRYVAALPRYVAALPRYVAALPRYVAALPRYVAALPRYVAALPRYVAALPRLVAALPRYVAALPCYVAALPRYVTALLRYVAALPRYVAALPRYVVAPQVAAPPRYVAALPRYVAALPRYVAALPRYVAALPRYVAALPRYVAALPRYVAALPRYVAALPRYVAALPRLVAALPCYVAAPHIVVPPRILAHTVFVFRAKPPQSSYGAARTQRFEVYQQGVNPDPSRWTPRSWDRSQPRDVDSQNTRRSYNEGSTASRNP